MDLQSALDENGYARALAELDSARQMRDRVKNSLDATTDPERLPQLFMDLAVLDSWIHETSDALAYKYGETAKMVEAFRKAAVTTDGQSQPKDQNNLLKMETMDNNERFEQIGSSEKEYRLTFEERPAYLYARIEATLINRDMVMAYLDEIADKCQSSKYDRLMVDRDIPEMLDDTAIYFIANEFIEKIPGIKTAIVNPYEDNADALKFAMMVVKNRGARFESFTNPEDAEVWLTA
jgi:hypothetical protein